jgi:hypothetical protein
MLPDFDLALSSDQVPKQASLALSSIRSVLIVKVIKEELIIQLIIAVHETITMHMTCDGYIGDKEIMLVK